jgi:hypothetical protein
MTKEKEIKVNSINLTIGNREISLTVDEARKLKGELDNLLSGSTVYYYYPLPVTLPTYPQLVYADTSVSYLK